MAKIYTVWADYAATGEGRSIMAWVGWAKDAEMARTKFVELFDDWFAKGAEVSEGLDENAVVSYLWSQAALDAAKKIVKDQAMLVMHTSLHFNYS